MLNKGIRDIITFNSDYNKFENESQLNQCHQKRLKNKNKIQKSENKIYKKVNHLSSKVNHLTVTFQPFGLWQHEIGV